jgi:hypothetical protein
LIIFGLVGFAGTSVDAQSFSVSSIQPVSGSIGTVTSDASGTTTYRISAATGEVIRSAGSGLPTSASGTRALVVIRCAGSGNACGSSSGSTVVAAVTVTAGGVTTGRALPLANFNVAAGSVTPSVTQGSGNSLTFTVAANFRNGVTHQFYLGGDFSISSAGSTGIATSSYVVTVSGAGNPGGSAATASFEANVRRPLSIARISHLAFGTVVRPASGSNTITIDPMSGSRAIFGAGNGALRSSTTSRAQFTVSGESGQVFDISGVPSTLIMNRAGGGSISVNLVKSSYDSVSLTGGGTAAPGSATIGVGGSFTISNSTLAGTYSGVFPITVSYN